MTTAPAPGGAASPENPFADAEPWPMRIDGPAGYDGFDFDDYSARCRENLRPDSVIAVSPTEAPPGAAGIVGVPTDLIVRQWLDLAVLSVFAERATARLEAGESVTWALTLDAGRGTAPRSAMGLRRAT